MKGIELKTPEGYFDESLRKTMAGVSRIRKRRKAALYACAAVLLFLGAAYASDRLADSRQEKAYLAQQAEIDRLDIFLEIN